jgi:hypothetical protein
MEENGAKPKGRCAERKLLMNSPDFSIEGEGRFCTVYLLRPLTPAALAWVEGHIPEDGQRLGNAVAIEHRFMGPIAEGIIADGLVLA